MDIERDIGQGVATDLNKLMTIFSVSEDDAMAVLIRYALDRMSAEDASMYFGRREGEYREHEYRQSDNSEVVKLRAELAAEHNYAYHDQLTGLWNRRAAMEALDDEPIVMVALADVDQFKSINDEWGHDAGDQVLQAVGVRLTGAMKDRGRVYRLGGDEFLILWQAVPTRPMAEVVRIRDLVNTVLAYRRQRRTTIKLHPMITLGVARQVGPAGEQRGRSLLARADVAMLKAKRGHEGIGMVTG